MAKKTAVLPTQPARGKKNTESEHDDSEANKGITTAIHIPEQTWKLLRAVAFHRAQDQGGRASVSKLITELVERHRAELEAEPKN